MLKNKLFFTLITLIQAMNVFAFASSDTIPPFFNSPPLDTTINCGDNIDSLFTLWYNNNAGSILDDNTANTSKTIALQEAIDSLIASHVDCSSNGLISVGYFGIDSCDNISEDTLFASFQILDNIQPTIVEGAVDKFVICNDMLQDTLAAWLNSIGGAMATDNCNDTVTWLNIIWEDNQGNSGFANIGDNYNIPLQRDSCLWSIQVAFFVEDLCGNINTTRASFGITKDTISPILEFAPRDTTISCNSTLDTIAPVFMDVCDNMIALNFIETNTQDADSTKCMHYNYTITRTWTGSDACQNNIEYSQNIIAQDTTPPTADFETIIIKDCDADLTIVNDFLMASDNCSQVSISFTDSLTVTSICQNQLIRSWTIVDVCNNTSQFKQTIQTQDFSPPTFEITPIDTMVSCDDINLESIFESWVSNFGSAQTVDNCTSIQQYVRTLPDLIDTLSIINGDQVELVISECLDNVQNNIVSNQELYFYAFDACGNINMASAQFSIIDTISPIINICPADVSIILPREQCDTIVNFDLPLFSDACLKAADANWKIILDNDFTIRTSNNKIETGLEIGTHTLNYILNDCANNTVECLQQILIRDTFPPILDCPNDLIINLPFDNCEVEFSVPELNDFSDNCFGASDFDVTLPNGNGLINFEYNPMDSSYNAISFPVEFDNIINEGRLFKPSIIIEYALNISEGSRAVLKSEFGDDLFIIEEGNCETHKEKLIIEENQFTVWSIDDDIKFTVLFEERNGDGIIPCFPENINNNIDSDDFSFFKITLQFSDIIPTFHIEDEGDNIISENEEITNLTQGEYNLIYEAFDFASNVGQCQTQISINDVSPPTISCSDQQIEITPEDLGQIDIVLDDLSIFIVDNCSTNDASFFPTFVSCQDIGKVVPVNIQAVDNDNNFSTCTANISIIGSELRPTFISGLCFADTLKLFSNIDNANITNFFWVGPNNYSSIEQNPVLTNINNQNTGIYNLIIINDEGCSFEGSINVQINQFTSPQISSNATLLCPGDQVLINSNAFTEDVNYFWFEGISPNGILIEETEGPSLELTPSLGIHQYYVEVKGEGCNSNASTTLEIEVVPAPQAFIEDPFITICQGDDISLSTTVFDENFTYEWRGPDAYFSDEQFAKVINNASDVNAGQYSLIINNGACSSLPAIAEVIIFEPPVQPIIVGETVFCEGQTSVLTVSNISNATRYHWYFNGNLFTSVSGNNLLIPSISSAQTGEWTVVVEDAICFSDTSEVFEIFVESSLNVGASNNGPVCDGDIVTLTSSFIPNATYQWQDPSGSFIDGREISVSAVDGVYTVTITTASNCIATTSTEVEVGTRPDITALSNTSLACMNEGESISFVSTVFPQGNYQYQWSGPNGFASSQIQPTIQNINQEDSGIYELVVIQDNCASQAVATNVNFTIKPDAAIIIGDEKLCVGEDLHLEIENPIQGNQVSWFWTTPLGSITTDVPELNLLNFDNTQVGNYSVTQELNGCRSGISQVIVITLESKPPTPIISGENVLCEGATLELSATTESNADYVWITPNGIVTQTDNTLLIENITGAQNGSYQVLTQKTNCISDTSAFFDIQVMQSPDGPEFFTNNISICADETQILEVCVNAANIDYDNLIIIDQSTNTVLQESNTTCFDLSFLIGNTSQSYILNVAAVKDGCQSSMNDEVQIDIFETPDGFIEILADTLFLCAQEFTTISPDIIPDNARPLWRSPDPEINIFNVTDIEPSFSNLREGNNQLIVSSSFGTCNNYASDTINVFVITGIDAEDDVFEGEYNQAMTVDILLNDNSFSDVFINDIEDTREGSVIINDNSTITIPSQNNFIGSYQIDYEICYVDCPDLCSTATITVNIGDNIDCFAGNVITPNGDGYNDTFKIPCLDSGNYNDNSLTIINQWGDEVFSASPYLNNWQGTFQQNKLPVGTYFYILELGDAARPIQGFIVIEE